MVNIERFKIPKYIKPVMILSTGISIWTSTSFSQGQNWDLSIEAITGNMYISTLTTAPTSTNTFKLMEGDCLDLKVEEYISMLGDSTTAAVQAIIWDK
jgi:hypothetical protein